ncbi:MAG: CHAT domain-containing protein, partial [Acidimicrobiia bacterium]
MDRRPALADALRATRRDALIRVTGEGAGRYRTELFIDGQARATASDLRIPFRPALHGDVGLGDLDRAAAAVTAVLAGGAVGEQLAALVQGLTVGTRVDVAVELPPDLLDLPVELTAVGGETRRPLALIPGVTLCRRPARHTAAAPPAPGAGPLKILAAIGAPDEDQTRAVPLDIEAEMGAILDATAQAQGVGAQVRILEAGDPKAIAQALAADDYHILHLSGHGNATSIELSDEDGYAVQVSAGDLADAVRKAGKMMPLVVLSSCHGGGSTEGFAARLLHEGFPRVLAMQAAVRDDYATRFAAELYTALTLDHARTTAAVAAARTQLLDDALLSHGGPRPSGEWATPALLMAAGDAALVDPAAELAPLRRPDAGALAGSVPLLDASGLIGRRGELRTIMRAITSDKRFTNQHGHQGGVIVTGTGGVGKSALVGRVIQRLSTEGWLAAVVSGEWSLNEATLQVVAAAGEASRKAVVQHLAAADDDRARLAAMTALLRSERILLVLDDFERNLHGAALDPLMADQLSRLIDAAGVGKLLVTCRYAVPQLVGLYRVALGPLSPNETRRLLLRLPGLRCLSAGQLQELHRLIGGHPRVLELLDATLLAGTARHPALARKLQRLADDLGIDLDDDRPVDDAVLDAMEMGAADIMLDDLVEQLDPGAGSLLCQVAVSSLPVALDELAEAAGTPSRELRKLAKHLADRSLFTARDPAWVHRWIAARLIARQPADEVREHHRLAARLRLSRIDRLHEVADGIEATRNLLVAGDWDQASTVGTGVVAFLEQHANVQLASFAAEVATALPRDHPDRRFFEDAELRALVALGRTELAVTRYQDMAHAAKQLAEAEPNRTDYQRDLSISYNRLGDLMVAVGDGEQAARYFNDSLTIRRRLAEAEPNRTDYQRDLSVSNNRLGDLKVAVGDGEQAARHFNDSLTIRRR